MGKPANCPDDEFLASVEELGAAETAKRYGYAGTQPVYNRISQIRKKLITSPTDEGAARHKMKIRNGSVVIGSDCHYWVGLQRSTAHCALLRLVEELAPAAVIANGDVIDAPSAGKHASIGWERRPALWDEIIVAQERLGEIEEVADGLRGGPVEIELLWHLGNHDARFESYLARVASQYKGVQGIHLKDHFPAWTPAWATWINSGDDLTVVKHRLGMGGGAMSVTRNFSKTGTHIVTSHTHAANVFAYSNYRGTFWAVDTGTLAVPYGPQFVNWTEDNPVNWRSAVTVLTYVDGHLLPPEQCIVVDEEKRLTAFRGRIHQESK